MKPKIRQRSRPQTVADHIEETSEPTYTVGRNKPPVHTRFGEPGGNRPGRKPKTHDFGEQLDRHLRTRVALSVNGKLTKFTKQDVIAGNIVNGAAARDKGMIRLLREMDKLAVIQQPQLADNHDGDELDDDALGMIRALAQLAGPGDAADRSDGHEQGERDEQASA